MLGCKNSGMSRIDPSQLHVKCKSFDCFYMRSYQGVFVVDSEQIKVIDEMFLLMTLSMC